MVSSSLLQIIRLESERTQWEQRYLEESAMRQVAIDAASIPKDAKIAALEKNSAESEKMIAEARSEKIKQLEEMQNTQVSRCGRHGFSSRRRRQLFAAFVTPHKIFFCCVTVSPLLLFQALIWQHADGSLLYPTSDV